MPPLQTRTDSPGRLQKYPNSMSALERNPQVPARALHEVLGPGTDGRGIPRGRVQLAWELAFPEATRAVPEVRVITGEHLHQLEKMQEVLPSRGDEDHFL